MMSFIGRGFVYDTLYMEVFGLRSIKKGYGTNVLRDFVHDNVYARVWAMA